MSGVVGQSKIRNDARQVVQDRTISDQVPVHVGEYTQEVKRIYRSESPDPARTTEVKTLFEFYDLFKKVLEFATSIDGTNYPINFSLEYPPSATELPCFTARLINRRPFSPRGTKEMAPRFRQEYEDPDYPGEVTQEYLLRRYNTVEITVWGKTNKVTQEMVEWLEDVYWQYLWALQWGGLAHPVEWLDRGSDRYEQIREQQMYGAPTTFGIITGKITKKRVTTLRKLAIFLGLIIDDQP